MKREKVLSKINPLILNGVAHRGLFSDKISENSLKAFELAIENNVAIELDVHITKDGELVVIHDEDLKRLTNKEGIVEHLTLNELNNYKLLDGQKIPTFKEVLELVNERVPILIELKVYEKNYKRLSNKIKEFLPHYIKDKKNYMFISFDPRSLWPLKKMGIIRLLLCTITHEYVYNYFRHTCDGLYLEDVFFSQKRVQKYSKKHFMNVWTIEKKEQIEKVLPYIDTLTYQLMDPKEVSSILKNKH